MTQQEIPVFGEKLPELITNTAMECMVLFHVKTRAKSVLCKHQTEPFSPWWRN